MNFYKHYMGDYARDTGHLTMVEHGAYRLLIDAHYATEKPLPADRSALYRLVRALTSAEQKAVETVVSQFWEERDGGLVNPRCQREISRASEQASTNRRIAREREARRKEHEPLNESSDGSCEDRPTIDLPNQTARLPDTKGSDVATATSADVDDLKAALFGPCLKWIAEQSERPASSLRSIVGRWIRDHGEARVLQAFVDAKKESPVEPVAWLTKTLKARSANGKRPDPEEIEARRVRELTGILAGMGFTD